MTGPGSAARLDRIAVLLSQRRYEMAQGELRKHLADDPEDAYAHALLSLALAEDPATGDTSRTLAQQQQLLDATTEAQSAIGLDPDDSLGHYAHAFALLRRGRPAEAIDAIRQSLRLEPHDPDALGLLAHAQLDLKQFQLALESAERGLAIDAENSRCNNLRAIALERLGRGDEAVQAAARMLRQDPDDPSAHTASGYTLLHAGRYQEAQIAFREALRLDPGNEMARSGMMHAINSGNFLFRWVYGFYVRLSRLDTRAAFGLIFGFWILAQVLARAGDTIAWMGAITTPLLLLYFGFVVLTWIAHPLFNTILRFHPFGKHLLNRSERWASNLIAPALALSLFSLVVGTIRVDLIAGAIVGWYWLVLTIPISAVFAMKTRKRMMIVAGVSLVIAFLPWWGLWQGHRYLSFDLVAENLRWFAYGCLAIQFLAQGLSFKPIQS